VLARAVLLAVMLAVMLAVLASGSIARGSIARASPGVDLDDPAYLELVRLRASGALPPYLGGLRPLTEARVQALRRAAGLAPDARLVLEGERRLWLAPIRHLRLRGALVRDRVRPYSNEDHPRNLAGGVALSCEHQQGRSCGDGAGLELELDSAAGYGPWLAASARVRAVTGSGDRDADAELDRAYASAELGPISFLVGRDAVVIGPSSRTQAMWGDHVAAFDQIRLASTPIPLLGAGGSILRASALYLVGRLREPQNFDGAMVDVTRLQLDLLDTAELGITHLIQFGGDGAPSYSFGDYVLEHFQHNAPPPQALGFANHRLSGDVAVSLPDLAGLRVYYELAAEDMRDEVVSMLRRDADHVLGVAVDRVTEHVGVLVELASTGVRSHEHELFTTGLTHGGRVTGHPLGPSSLAAWIGLRLAVRDAELRPWLELARQSNDRYAYGTGDIVRTEDLPEEWRTRAGARTAWDLTRDLRLELRAWTERVATADFVPARVRWNASFDAIATWRPAWRLAR
jgi:Capsule assembly protein Wzi